MTRRLTATFALLSALSACAATQREAEEPQAVWEDPDHDPYNFHRSLSMTLLRTQQYMKASATIRKMRKLHPSDPEPPYLMACAHIGLKEFPLAKQELEIALELDEDYAPAISKMGVLLNMTGKHREAHTYHRRAIARDPENTAYHNNLGFSLYLAGDYRGAIRAYQEALRQDPGARRVHNNLGFAFGKLGDMDAAHKHFRLAGVPAQASNNIGFLYEQRGEFERAYDFYLLAAREDPLLIQARKNLERVCKHLGRPVPDIPLPPPPHQPPQPPAGAEVAVHTIAGHGERPIEPGIAPTTIEPSAKSAAPRGPWPAPPPEPEGLRP